MAFELIERSDGYLGVTDAARYFAATKDWSATSHVASGRAQGRILDIGAGAGRVSLALQREGLDVVALDISEGAIEVCKDRGVRSVFKGTVFDLAATRPAPFDTFLMLGNQRPETSRVPRGESTVGPTGWSGTASDSTPTGRNSLVGLPPLHAGRARDRDRACAVGAGGRARALGGRPEREGSPLLAAGPVDGNASTPSVARVHGRRAGEYDARTRGDDCEVTRRGALTCAPDKRKRRPTARCRGV